jgi:hypothetical protein
MDIKHKFWQVSVLFAVLKLLQTLNTAISVVPRLRLYEATICRSYYQIHDPSVIDVGNNVPEELCKIPQIQASLARLTGWNSFFFYIPSEWNFEGITGESTNILKHWFLQSHIAR